MHDASESVIGAKRILLALASQSEARAVLGAIGGPVVPDFWTLTPVGRIDVVLTGVGKANGAGAVARLLDPSRHGLVLSLGIGGLLPAPGSGARVLDVVVATECVFADEGVQTPGGFVDIGALGFPPGGYAGTRVPVVPRVVETLARPGWYRAPVATVSTCSGTDTLAAEIARRTGALAEGMEGAAAAHAAWRVGVPAGEVRVISNRTGDRERQGWDIPGALGVLARVGGELLAGQAR